MLTCAASLVGSLAIANLLNSGKTFEVMTVWNLAKLASISWRRRVLSWSICSTCAEIGAVGDTPGMTVNGGSAGGLDMVGVYRGGEQVSKAVPSEPSPTVRSLTSAVDDRAEFL